MSDQSRDDSTPIPLPSERRFGLLFAAVFFVFAVYAFFKQLPPAAAVVGLVLAAVFLVAAFAFPRVLRPLNKAWYWLGITLGKIVSPVVLGLIFFLLITPAGLIGRMLGRDELKLKKKEGAASYWVDRSPPGPAPESFKNQF